MDQKRQLVAFVFSNLQFRGKKLEFSLRSPLDLMVNRASYSSWLAFPQGGAGRRARREPRRHDTQDADVYRRALGARFRQGRRERACLYSGAARGWIASRGVSALGAVDLLVRQVGFGHQRGASGIAVRDMRQRSAYDEEVHDFAPPSAANQSLTCDLLVAGGGLSGLSAAEAALRCGLNVVVIEKGVFGKDAASGLNAGQFLTGWAKSVDVMLAELTQQELRRGTAADQAGGRTERRVRAFLRRTVEGCLCLAELDRRYNLRASVQHGAVMAALNEADMAGLRAAYQFMEKSSLRALMPPVDGHRPPFFKILSARQLAGHYGTAEGFYAGGVIDRFGGSFYRSTSPPACISKIP